MSGAASGAVQARRGRRQLIGAVVATTAAGSLVLLAASRTWMIETSTRPAPLPPVSTTYSGASILPWLPALALVALAGAGALVATRGRGRIGVGILLIVTGLGILFSAASEAATSPWATACLLGGAIVAGVGGVAVRRGTAWPVMGTRYERPRSTPNQSDRDLWESLDRGDDPTDDRSDGVRNW